MLSRITTETIVFLFAALSAGTAFAIEPCHRGVPTITIDQGNFAKAPRTMDPDAETASPGRQIAGAAVAQSAHRDPTAQSHLSLRKQRRLGNSAGDDRHLRLGA
jgi:hypothetical protein